MNRKRPRRLLNLLTALSALLCVAALAGWVLSHHGPLRDPYGFGTATRHLWLYDGTLGLEHFLPDHGAGAAEHDWGWNAFDVAYYRHFWGRRQEWTSCGIRLLPVAAAALVLPLVRLVSQRLRRERRPAGLCRKCGYDLTGNVSGVCPECGKGVGA